MKLEVASHKAIKYSCLNYHYSKSVPSVLVGYSVFNNNDEFCGTICYGAGANKNINKEFNLQKGEVIELVRVALNGKQKITSQVLAMSLKLIQKHLPTVKVIVSYADDNQNHKGIIYQSTNWIYLGKCAYESGIYLEGKLTHRRTINSRYGTSSIEKLKLYFKDVKIAKSKGKFKYVFSFDKNIRKELLKKSLPYPKNETQSINK